MLKDPLVNSPTYSHLRFSSVDIVSTDPHAAALNPPAPDIGLAAPV